MKKNLTFYLLLILNTCFSQDINYAREVVQKLASPTFKGRGYVGNGDGLAAQYITKEFRSNGLHPFKNSFIQKFTTSVNTFPGVVRLNLGGETLKPGVDFLVDPGSQGVSGKFSTVRVKLPDIFDLEVLRKLLSSSQGKFIVLDPFNRKDFEKEQLKQIDDFVNFLKYHPNNIAAGSILLTRNKLTWGGSTTQNPKPTFIVKVDADAFPIDTVEVRLDQVFINKYQTQNVVGYIKGQNTDSLVVFTAHYDHLGMMGNETVFPGANDNASGIAMLMNLARQYRSNQPKYSTAFIAFGGEEIGLLGSQYFVENPLFELEKIKFLINFDLSGTGDDGIQVVNGSVYREQFDQLVELNEEYDLLPQVKIRGEACNSDHCLFYRRGVPSFFIYTLGGIQAYHDIYDKAETLPLTEFEDYFRLMVAFVEGL